MGVKANLIATKLKKLREGFIRQLPSQLYVIKEAYAALGKGDPTKEALEELHRCFHTLRGSSANFGLDALSAVASEGEQLAKKVRKGEADPEIPWRPLLEEHIAQLEREVANINPLQLLDLQAMEIVAAAETYNEKECKLLYLCEDDSYQRLNLATQIGCFGFEVVSFGELEQFRNAVLSGPPDVIVMDLVYPNQPTVAQTSYKKYGPS